MQFSAGIVLTWAFLTTVSATLVPTAEAQAFHPSSDQSAFEAFNGLDAALSGRSSETQVLENNVSVPANITSNNVFDLHLSRTRIVVPNGVSEPVRIGEGTEEVAITRPFASQSERAVAISDGVVANRNANGTKTVTAVKADASVQMATIIEGVDAPERFSYQLDLPQGTKITQERGLVFLWSASGDLIGGFIPAWAKDAQGKDLPTRYEVEGTTLTQVVEHGLGTSYPVLADPLYVRGMIQQVNFERWAQGGWEIQLEVTALARYTWLWNPALVYGEGLQDLREHHPRSMASATMAQQWECHVVGLPATNKIDLESYRRSYPGWREGIASALLAANPAQACNW